MRLIKSILKNANVVTGPLLFYHEFNVGNILSECTKSLVKKTSLIQKISRRIETSSKFRNNLIEL